MPYVVNLKEKKVEQKSHKHSMEAAENFKHRVEPVRESKDTKEPAVRDILKAFLYSHFKESSMRKKLGKDAAKLATERTIALVCEKFKEGHKDPEAKSGIGEQTVLHDPKRWLAKRKDKFKKYWDSYAKKLVKEKY